MYRTCCLLVLLVGLPLGSRPAAAQEQHPDPVDRTRLAAFNVALSGTFALGRRWVEGDVDDWRDALETFAAGAAGGYGFYQAKRLVGEGRPLASMGLAHLSASVVENTSTGEHPLGAIRLGPGPLDLRLRTPLARTEAPPLTVEVNALAAAAGLVFLVQDTHRPLFRAGTLGFRNTRDYTVGLGEGLADGYAVGRTFVFSRDAVALTERHELIHVIQALQVGAVTPRYRLGDAWTGLDRSLGRHAAWDVQLDWLYAAFGLAMTQTTYRRRLPEIEAHTLDAPPRRPPAGCPHPKPGGCGPTFF